MCAVLVLFACGIGGNISLSQEKPSSLKAVLEKWKGRDIMFNDGTAANRIVALYDDYMECRLDKTVT